jgi:hypothetical protein
LHRSATPTEILTSVKNACFRPAAVACHSVLSRSYDATANEALLRIYGANYRVDRLAKHRRKFYIISK